IYKEDIKCSFFKEGVYPEIDKVQSMIDSCNLFFSTISSNLSALIEEEVRLPTQILNPFSSITYDPNVFSPEYMDAISSVASIPIGLAIRAGGKKQ
ncbi:MAG: hypothetical protein CL678_04375, partial [Bdellovibrionaceae bacterium]|nr:hypothetical protein [Pseudobdellovibrionaceae bacterium]